MRPVISAFLLGLLAAGCSSPTAPGEVEAAWLSFLKDGSTTREQVLLELGASSSSFEDGRILTSRLRYDSDLGVVPVPGGLLAPKEDYHLVVVFDQNGVVERHNLRLLE